MCHPESEHTINPLVLPAETDGRFTMLILSSMMITLEVSMIVMVLVTVGIGPIFIADFPWTFRSTNYLSNILNDRDIRALSETEIKPLATVLATSNLIGFAQGLPRLVFVTILLLLVIGCAYGVYRAYPAITRRRQRLRALSDFGQTQQAQQIQTTIQTIAAEVGLAPPEVLIRTSEHIGGQVFGLPRRYVLRLDATPLTQQSNELDDLARRNPEEFRALILHELGHIANRDVARSHFAEAIGGTLIALVLLPFAVISLGVFLLLFLWLIQLSNSSISGAIQPLIRPALALTLQFCVLIVFILVSRRELLRVREFYADWRAALWGAAEPLKAMLQHSIKQRETSERSGWRLAAQLRSTWARLRSWAVSLWRFHTPPQERLERLSHPLLLFKVSPQLAFHTGVLLAFVTIGVIMAGLYLGMAFGQIMEVVSWGLVQLVFQEPGPYDRIQYNTIIIFRVVFQLGAAFALLILLPYLSAGSLGRQIQRAAVADLLPDSGQHWRSLELWRTAFWIALGQEAGLWMLPASLFMSQSMRSFGLVVLWIILFSILIWFWLVYTRALTQRVLGRHSGNQPPRRKRWLVTGFAVIGLWFLYFPVLLGRLSIATIDVYSMTTSAMTQLVPSYPITMMLVVSLFILFSVGIALFGGWAALTLGLSWLWTRSHPLICPTCRQRIAHPQAVGRRCTACYSQLASWLYIPPRRQS